MHDVASEVCSLDCSEASHTPLLLRPHHDHSHEDDCKQLMRLCCRWDLLKRAPKELADHIIGRAQSSMVDDKDICEQYRECKAWQRCAHW